MEPLTLFTGALVVATFLLVVVGGFQAWLIFQAYKKDKRVERAYVDMSHSSWNWVMPEPNVVDGWPIQMVLRNHGKTPARTLGLGLIALENELPDERPEPPPYREDPEFGKTGVAVIMPNEDITVAMRLKQLDDYIVSMTDVWIFGYVDYQDVFGACHRNWYLRRWVDPSHMLAPGTLPDAIPQGERNNLAFGGGPQYHGEEDIPCPE